MTRSAWVLVPATALSLSLCLLPAPSFADTADEQIAAASAQFDAGHYADAIKTLDLFIAAHPKSPKIAAAALTLGRSHSLLKQFAAAIPGYQRAIAAHDPATQPLAELGLGEAALQTGKWAIARTALSDAVSKTLADDQAPIAWDWLGQADYQLADYAGAEKAYLKVVNDYPDSTYSNDAEFGAGLAALKQGDTANARKCLQATAKQSTGAPYRAQANLLLGQMELSSKNYSVARTRFEEALSSNPTDTSVSSQAQIGLVSALLALGDDGAAVEHLKSILTALPAQNADRPRLQMMLGHAQYRQKKYPEALAAYNIAATATDKSVASEAAYWAGNCETQLGHSAQAAKHYAAARSLDPTGTYGTKAQTKIISSIANSDDPAQLASGIGSLPAADRGPATIRLARIYIAKNNYTQASALLQKFVAVHPSGADSAEGSYLLGIADIGLQKNTAAAAAFAVAVQGSPNAEWAMDAHIQRASLLVRTGKAAAAEADATAILTSHTQGGIPPETEQNARLILLQAQLDQQKWPAARENSNTLLKMNLSADTSATVLYAQATALDQLKQPDAARSVWETIVSQHHSSPYAADAERHLADIKFDAKDYDGARTGYLQSMADDTDKSSAAETSFKLGSTLYNLTQYSDAAKRFDAAASAQADPSEALYWAGASYEKAGEKQFAIARLTSLVSKYPTSARVEKAKVRLAALKAVS